MNKFKLTISIVSLILLSSAKSAFAAGPSVAIVNLPEYMNTANFNISYSAIAPAGLKNVTLQFHKEGDSWQTLATFTGNADQTNVQNKIGSDAKYYFSATACDNSDDCTTDYTETIIDRIAPAKVANFSSDRIADNTYRLRWLNPGDDDLTQVYIYRADTLGFNADSGTQIGAVNVTKDTASEWNNTVPVDGKNYYYLIRAIDRAGNASEVWGDMLVTTTTTTTEPTTGTPVTGKESLSGQELVLSPSVLGANADVIPEPTIVEPTTFPTPESAITTQVNQIVESARQTSPLWPVLGFVAVVAAIYWFVGKNGNHSAKTKSTAKRGKRK